MLTSSEISRYSRHLLLPEIGMEGQERLKESSVLVVGAGGLGSPLMMYLAAAGVGRLGIVDFDTVDESNLQRQVLYGKGDVGKKKVDAAISRLQDLNEHISIERYDVHLTSENALDIIRMYDVIADGTDNFPTRYLVNDACVLTKKVNVYASIFRFDGQVSVFGTADGPCYRCVYPDPPPPGMVPSCAEGGVLGVLPGILGSIQATEVVKMICGIGDPLVGRLLLFDALDMQFRTLKVHRDPECRVCGTSPTISKLIDYEVFCNGSHHSTEVATETPVSGKITSSGIPELSALELKAKLDAEDDILLLDVRTPVEYQMTNIGGTLIPLPELQERLYELDDFREQEIVVVCRSGARSGSAVSFMRKNGFSRAINLNGGLLAWSDTVDPSITKY
ncbi:MAG: molybdopterin-synthase adenylyltransferase MoeB [Rhodothermia bacterium]|nr:MAG: molybdopterin-synthase adenylyltransferase MoeB [Rhodothermia bacterium]